jgi:pyruvate dehydrogenase E2 component (dihydrolipoamide acetyltransferase)
MRRELLVPKLGLTMTEGVLVEWMVAPGASFKANESLFVIESEKAAIEIPAEGDGVLLEVTADLGVTLPVGSVIGFWDDGVAGQSSAVAANGPAITNDESSASPTPIMTSAGAIAPVTSVVTRVPITPLARRLAEQRGIDLSQIHGSGPRGRIRARDLPEAGLPVANASNVFVPDAQVNGRTSGTGILCQPSATEKTIARRLTAAKRDIPHFYLAVEAEVSRLQALRAELNAAQTSVRFTLNHFIVAAVGRSLVEMPQINRVWTDEGILSLNASDVGMAVSTERGLTVPVLRNVGGSSLAGIASVASCAIERALAGRLAVDEMAGGSITVSNAGMHDVTYMTSIINPGQAMILGVGSVRELFRPDAAGQPALRREIGLVLSADHRVLDGVSALAFLKRIVGYLEQPLALLVSV